MAGETMSISDLFGLNSPRGLLGNPFGNSYGGAGGGVCSPSPPASSGVSPGYQLAYNDNKLDFASVTSGSHLKRALSVGSNSSNASSGFYSSHTLRSNDCSGNSTPSTLEHSLATGVGAGNSGVDIDNSAIYNADSSLTELLNSMTIKDALTRESYLAGASDPEFRAELELCNLRNLQAWQAIKYLQQPPSLLSSLLNSARPNNASQLQDRWNGNNTLGLPSSLNAQQENLQLDRAARYHRCAASVCDATCTWSGVLPVRSSKPIGYSSKVFLGGVPWDISEQLLVQTFKPFGPIRVEWPGKEKQAFQPKGYVYIIFESEKNVKALLQACTNDFNNNGNWYFKISSKRMKSKEVQVIPWILNDSNYTKSTSQKLDPSKTVFVGALHGMLNAEGLAKIMNDLFDGVVYAGIDTDKYKYPIGSGRVTFNNTRSYMKAVSAGFIEIKTAKFTKKVQVDPYLEDSICSLCAIQQGPYFCRDIYCFRYYCHTCWQLQHVNDNTRHHKPLMRNSKNSSNSCASGGPSTNNTN